MKITNIRHGFATNSSSSHSLIILTKGQAIPDNDDEDCFGWNSFTLSNETSKEAYLASQKYHLHGHLDDPTRSVDDLNLVDHQSIWGGEGLNITDRITQGLTDSEAVIGFLTNLIKKSNTVILGGNDNQEPEHHLLETLTNGGAIDLGRESCTLVRDPLGHNILFSKEKGTKFRISEDERDVPRKGTWPELMDVKITDYCAYGCSYCYMGSTRRGQHADINYLRSLASLCRESGVLEVALGGGEPTEHPQFKEIVQAFKEAGLIVNVTSRNIDYWADRTASDLGISAVAFSIDSTADVVRINTKFKGIHTNFERHFQLVAGTVTTQEFSSIMCAIGRGGRLTLLGYKDTGRGLTARRTLPIHDHPNQSDWIDVWRGLVTKANADSKTLRAWFDKKHKDLFTDRRGAYWRAGDEGRLLVLA